jgi:tetratricopeptide (TPR) repeat protein
MAWDDVLFGRQSYKDWIQAQDIGRQVGQEIATVHAETQTALASVARVGLGALEDLGRDLQATLEHLGIRIADVGDGIAALHADFNLHLTELIWQAQQQNEKLDRLLYASEHPETIRAREKRNRARFAHASGLWEDAKRNYEEALRLNEFDFTVYRSLGDLYLLHFQDPKTAFGYYADAARYAGAHSRAIAAENLYMAGTAAAVQQKREDALRLFEKALEILPAFGDAAFQAACLASLLRQPEKLIAHLEHAISVDGRYLARARESKLFDGFRSTVIGCFDAIENRERDMTRATSTQLIAEADGADTLAFEIMTGPIRKWAQATHAGAGTQAVPELRQCRAEAVQRATVLYGEVREAAKKRRLDYEAAKSNLEKETSAAMSGVEAGVRDLERALADFRKRERLTPVHLGCSGLIVWWVSSLMFFQRFRISSPESADALTMAASCIVGVLAVFLIQGIEAWWMRNSENHLKARLQMAQRTRTEAVARIQESHDDRIHPLKEAIESLTSIIDRYSTPPFSVSDYGRLLL